MIIFDYIFNVNAMDPGLKVSMHVENFWRRALNFNQVRTFPGRDILRQSARASDLIESKSEILFRLLLIKRNYENNVEFNF